MRETCSYDLQCRHLPGSIARNTGPSTEFDVLDPAAIRQSLLSLRVRRVEEALQSAELKCILDILAILSVRIKEALRDSLQER